MPDYAGQDLAVVGAAGLECVFVFRRNFNKRTNSWKWQPGEKLVSEEYDYDLILGRTYMHRQDFGVSVASHKRTIVVGAPHADYGNQGETDLRETYVGTPAPPPRRAVTTNNYESTADLSHRQGRWSRHPRATFLSFIPIVKISLHRRDAFPANPPPLPFPDST